MDKKVEKKRWTIKKIGIVSLSLFLIAFALYSFLSPSTSVFKVDSSTLIISEVERGEFQEYIPRTGIILPEVTQYIDARQPGIIKSIHKESGAFLKEGDVIMTLSNPDLELMVMSQESALYEQLSILRNSRLQLDQNNLNQKAQLAEIDYQLKVWHPQYMRYSELYEKGLISKREFEEVKYQYDYNQTRKRIFEETYRNDSISRTIQLSQMYKSEVSMLKSLEAVQNLLDNLIIRSPIEGNLVLSSGSDNETESISEFQIGQSVKLGDRIGQIDKLDRFKVRVPIDEHYLHRIALGQQGSSEVADNEYLLKVYKIYPTVKNGLFYADMKFDEDISTLGVRSGQSLRIRLELGSSQKTILLSSGGFYSSTGGNWVYKVVEDGKAKRRNVKLGRKNPEFYEVISGLKSGDKVVTSSYDHFGDNEILILN